MARKMTFFSLPTELHQAIYELAMPARTIRYGALYTANKNGDHQQIAIISRSSLFRSPDRTNLTKLYCDLSLVSKQAKIDFQTFFGNYITLGLLVNDLISVYGVTSATVGRTNSFPFHLMKRIDINLELQYGMDHRTQVFYYNRDLVWNIEHRGIIRININHSSGDKKFTATSQPLPGSRVALATEDRATRLDRAARLARAEAEMRAVAQDVTDEGRLTKRVVEMAVAPQLLRWRNSRRACGVAAVRTD